VEHDTAEKCGVIAGTRKRVLRRPNVNAGAVIPPFSSAVIIPVPATEPLVGDLRRDLDPSARRGAPAHITLVVPFVPAPVPQSVVDELTSMFAAVAPFELQFHALGRFERTLFLTPAPFDKITALIDAVVRRWPEHPPYGGIYDTIVPHLTVADDQDPALFEPLMAKLTPRLPLTTTIAEAWVIESDQHSVWHRRAALPFTAAPGA
jgi:2'-5' RNA ligase